MELFVLVFSGRQRDNKLWRVGLFRSQSTDRVRFRRQLSPAKRQIPRKCHIAGGISTGVDCAKNRRASDREGPPRIWKLGIQMATRYEMTFPCFIVRRDDATGFAIVNLPTGERAIVILSNPNFVNMFLFEQGFTHHDLHPLPINTPAGLAQILVEHLPAEVTHVVFNPNSVQPHTVSIDALVRLLKGNRPRKKTIEF